MNYQFGTEPSRVESSRVEKAKERAEAEAEAEVEAAAAAAAGGLR